MPSFQRIPSNDKASFCESILFELTNSGTLQMIIMVFIYEIATSTIVS